MNRKRLEAKVSEEKVIVQCVVCGKHYKMPAESWRRYQEESGKAYICNACQDFDHTNGQNA